jgi:hypothetical protein
MKRRIAWILALVCAAVLLAPAAPAAAQESPQTVRAAIPPQMPQTPTPPAASTPPQARPAVAQPPAPPTPRPDLAPPQKSMSEYEAANVKVEVTITYQVGNAAPVKRMATLTVADGGRGSLRAGNQVAVASTTFQPATTIAPQTVPMTSYSYKSVGFNLDASRVFTQGTKTRMDLSVEFSTIDEKTSDSAGHLPSFPTFSQNLTLVLESGKPLIVGQSSDVVDNVERKQTVEVKATILR